MMVFITSETVLASFDPGRVPQHRVHHRPELEARARAAGDLILQKPGEVLTVDESFGSKRRALERRQAARAEVALTEPFLHRRAEALLAPIDHVVVEIRRGRFFQDLLA